MATALFLFTAALLANARQALVPPQHKSCPRRGAVGCEVADDVSFIVGVNEVTARQARVLQRLPEMLAFIVLMLRTRDEGLGRALGAHDQKVFAALPVGGHREKEPLSLQEGGGGGLDASVFCVPNNSVVWGWGGEGVTIVCSMCCSTTQDEDERATSSSS